MQVDKQKASPDIGGEKKDQWNLLLGDFFLSQSGVDQSYIELPVCLLLSDVLLHTPNVGTLSASPAKYSYLQVQAFKFEPVLAKDGSISTRIAHLGTWLPLKRLFPIINLATSATMTWSQKASIQGQRWSLYDGNWHPRPIDKPFLCLDRHWDHAFALLPVDSTDQLVLYDPTEGCLATGLCSYLFCRKFCISRATIPLLRQKAILRRRPSTVSFLGMLVYERTNPQISFKRTKLNKTQE